MVLQDTSSSQASYFISLLTLDVSSLDDMENGWRIKGN
jgi:hypothetical protein